MAGPGVHQGAEHHLAAAGVVFLPHVEHGFDLLALQPVLRAAQITGDDRIIHVFGEFLAVLFGHMGQGAVNEQIPLLVQQFWRHGRQPAAVKQVHHESFQNIIPVVAKDHGAAAFFPRDPVQVAPAQTGTHGAIGAPRGHFGFHDGIGVLIFDPVRDIHGFEELRQHGCRKIWLPLIQIAGEQVHRQQPAPLQLVQDGQHGVAVLATGQTHQPFGTATDHPVSRHRLAGLPHDPAAQLFKGRGCGGVVEQRVDVGGGVEHEESEISLEKGRNCVSVSRKH